MTGDSPEQTTSEETETSEEKSEEITETAKRITSWTWNDEEEMLDLEENVLALPGASKDHIVSFDDIVSFFLSLSQPRLQHLRLLPKQRIQKQQMNRKKRMEQKKP